MYRKTYYMYITSFLPKLKTQFQMLFFFNCKNYKNMLLESKQHIKSIRMINNKGNDVIADLSGRCLHGATSSPM